MDGKLWLKATFIALIWFSLVHARAHVEDRSEHSLHWVQLKASTPHERGRIANVGASIEMLRSDYVMAFATDQELLKLKEMGLVLNTSSVKDLSPLDFPEEDSAYHNYTELMTELRRLAAEYSDIMQLASLGESVQGREIPHVRISTDLANSQTKPAIAFLGGHHAREHISVETPLRYVQELLRLYREGDTSVRQMVETREIHIVPVVNPDGKEYDIDGREYRWWRKNRAPISGRVRGVDLNRNYAWQWGTVGASPDPGSETYRGPSAFSEPESLAIKQFIETHTNISILVSFHSFSELILYPWGHKDDAISNIRDFQVHKSMAEQMARWNGYQPMQSSQLYPASGDTTDWTYGAHGIISFTFELDPQDMGRGGFYLSASEIENVVRKNWRPILYLMEYADNPYRVLAPTHEAYGLRSALISSPKERHVEP